MPGAIEYLPNDPDIRAASAKELRERRAKSARAWQYYKGDHRKHLKIDKNKVDDNVVINLAKQVVNRTVSFRVAKFPDLELDELKDTDAEKRLRTIWKKNGGPKLLAKMVKTGSIDGHVFVKTMPAKAGKSEPRIVNLDPANIVPFWQVDDVETVLWYEIHWEHGKTYYRQDVVDRGDAWWIGQYEGTADPASQNGEVTWSLVDEDDWLYPLGPIVDSQHGLLPKEFWGEGDLEALPLNDKVNKVTSDNSRIVRFHAAPKTIGTGMAASEVTATAVENLWTIENPDAKVYNLEMKGDLAASEALAARLKEEFLAETRTVVLSGNASDFQRVTELGSRLVFIDALAKNDELGWVYADVIEAVSQRVMMLDAQPDYETSVLVKWADPLPVDPLQQRQGLALEQKMGGVSKETIQEDLGRNPTQEEERLAAEGKDKAAAMPEQPSPIVALPTGEGNKTQI